ADPIPLRRLREPDPLRRHRHATHPLVPPLHRRRRADRGGHRGPRGAGRGGLLPLVRVGPCGGADRLPDRAASDRRGVPGL
ncbi:MAG: hypothetical protein AVDCRST_MAG20-593, partial [uncultured Acidimicrobiales bacterium]